MIISKIKDPIGNNYEDKNPTKSYYSVNICYFDYEEKLILSHTCIMKNLKYHYYFCENYNSKVIFTIHY